MLINGAGWAPSFPRLMTNEQLAVALEKAQQVGRGRFICVGDISCDVKVGALRLESLGSFTEHLSV